MSFFLIIMCFHSLRSKALFRNKRIRIFLIYIVIKKIPVESTTNATDKFERKVLTMRTKEEFVSSVTTLVEEMLGSGYLVHVKTIPKNNDTMHLAMEISRTNSRIAPVIYLDEYFEQYRLFQTDIYTIVQRIIDVYETSVMSDPISEWEELKEGLSKEYILKNVFFKVVNENLNGTNLLERPSRHISGDLTMIFCINIDSPGQGLASITISDRLCEMYDLTIQELFDNAMRNTPEFFPMAFQNIASVISGMIGFSGLQSNENTEPDIDLYVLTNNKQINGASVLFYPGVLQEISTRLDSDLFLIPSSIHEFLVLKTTGNQEIAQSLTSIIKEVNDTQVGEEEILSYQLYYYSRQQDIISVA